jgi:hypothetical protein
MSCLQYLLHRAAHIRPFQIWSARSIIDPIPTGKLRRTLVEQVPGSQPCRLSPQAARENPRQWARSHPSRTGCAPLPAFLDGALSECHPARNTNINTALRSVLHPHPSPSLFHRSMIRFQFPSTMSDLAKSVPECLNPR